MPAAYKGLGYHELNAMLNLYGPNGEIQFDKDREAARQYFLQHVNHNTVFFHDLRGEARLPRRRTSTTSARSSTSTRSNFIRELFNRAYKKKFRFETFLGAFKYYTSLHAEDVRRKALPGALRGPRLHGGPAPGPRGREARHAHGRRDHRGPLPAGHPDVPQRRQGAARRARLLLPAAHRRQHGVDRARPSTPPCSCPSAAAASPCADQHPRGTARRSSRSRTSPPASSP